MGVSFISCIDLALICFPNNLLFSTLLDFSYFSRAMEKTVGGKKKKEEIIVVFQALVLDSVQLNENSVQITE